MPEKILPSHSIQAQLTQIINVKPPTIYCKVYEKNLGVDLNIPCIESTLKEQFVKFYGATFTENEALAHLIIRGEFNTNPRGEPFKATPDSPPMYSANAKLKFNIFDNEQRKELYSTTINALGRSYVDFEDAGKDGCIRMDAKINDNAFIEIMKALE